ncbi:helix-turn-helix domain-containing protein [Nocardioides humi]|uniref:helix-turn-helix domain-containing protein n=1 Tax=Nocardioides humi TaxID=449461 RepID=UPI001C641E64
MSKRRLVITAALAGASQSEVARTYHVSQGWISRLMARCRKEGEAAFEPRAPRPRSSPKATSPASDRRTGATAAQGTG